MSKNPFFNRYQNPNTSQILIFDQPRLHLHGSPWRNRRVENFWNLLPWSSKSMLDRYVYIGGCMVSMIKIKIWLERTHPSLGIKTLISVKYWYLINPTCSYLHLHASPWKIMGVENLWNFLSLSSKPKLDRYIGGCMVSRRVDSSLEIQLTCMCHYKVKPPLYKKFIEKH